MSTISVALSRRLAAAHGGRQQHYVAAPVFGRPEAAAAGKLFIVAAGPTKQVERCQALFDAMGQKTFVLDEEPSSANVTKLAGNFLISTTIESLAEAFSLIRKSGVDPNKFLEVLTGSLFSAPVVINYGGMIAANHFEPVGFKLPLGLKDNRLVLAAADEAAGRWPVWFTTDLSQPWPRAWGIATGAPWPVFRFEMPDWRRQHNPPFDWLRM